jgi:hypothetical protein
VATKQAAANIKNAERARNTEATFGKDSAADPWRDSPALAGFRQGLTPSKSVRGAGTSAPGDIAWVNEWKTAAYTDRFGTTGAGAKESDFEKPERAPAAQEQNARLKGASTGVYRVPIGEVVQ